MIWFLFLAAILLVGLVGGALCAPFWNRLFSLIWQDPSERERDDIKRRLLEVHLRNGMPPETAAMLVAKEVGGTEQELLDAAQLIGAEGIRRLAGGRPSFLERALGWRNSWYRGSGGR